MPVPVRKARNPTSVPSGLQKGLKLLPSNVNGANASCSTSYSQMSESASTPSVLYVQATVRPSGEMLGARYWPKGSVALSGSTTPSSSNHAGNAPVCTNPRK